MLIRLVSVPRHQHAARLFRLPHYRGLCLNGCVTLAVISYKNAVDSTSDWNVTAASSRSFQDAEDVRDFYRLPVVVHLLVVRLGTSGTLLLSLAACSFF